MFSDFFFYCSMINSEETNDSLFKALEPVITGMGYDLVDLTHARLKSALQVQCIIYSEAGISLDDCSKVHRAVLPIIELLEDTRDVNLQVSSPGINRKLKKKREFAVFKKRRIKLFIDNDWADAVIEEVDDNGVNFRIEEADRYLLFSEIMKAKLE